MKNIYIICISFLLLSFYFNDGPWIFKKEKNGIKVYVASKNGSNYKKSKTYGSVKTNLNSLHNFLINPINYKKFSSKIEKVKVIKKTAKKILYYMSIDLPWPISNRDGIYELTVNTKTANESSFTIVAKPNYIPKQNGYIRIKIANTYYKLKQNGNKVDIIYTSHTDPNGNVPAWVSNYYLEDGPIGNITAMRKALEK